MFVIKFKSILVYLIFIQIKELIVCYILQVKDRLDVFY